jgi:L-2-hydroxyglutarate oxidase LhgO
VRGNTLLAEYCAQRGIPFRRDGKLVIGDMDSLPALERIKEHAIDCGIDPLALTLLDADGVKRHEPACAAPYGLHIGTTGILDSAALIRSYVRDAEDAGVHLITGTEVTRIARRRKGVGITTKGRGADQATVDVLVNAAGLHADELARKTRLGHTLHPCRGEYALIRQPLIKNIVYPLPHADGKSVGMHWMRTTAGDVMVGPSAEYDESKCDYRHRLPLAGFIAHTSAFFPKTDPERFSPAFVGIRAKLRSSAESAVRDFCVIYQREGGLIAHVLGYDSPGLTASLSFGEWMAKGILERM